VAVIVSVSVGRASGVDVDVEVAELTAGSGVPVGKTARVWATAVFNMDSAVPALSTTGGVGAAGAGVKGRQAVVRRITATGKTVHFTQPSLRL
jgi:hypothetical protein